MTHPMTNTREAAARSAWEAEDWQATIVALRAWKDDDELEMLFCTGPTTLNKWSDGRAKPREGTRKALYQAIGEWAGWLVVIPDESESLQPFLRWARWAQGPNLIAGDNRRVSERPGMFAGFPDEYVISPKAAPGEPKITMGDVRRLILAYGPRRVLASSNEQASS